MGGYLATHDIISEGYNGDLKGMDRMAASPGFLGI